VLIVPCNCSKGRPLLISVSALSSQGPQSQPASAMVCRECSTPVRAQAPAVCLQREFNFRIPEKPISCQLRGGRAATAVLRARWAPKAAV